MKFTAALLQIAPLGNDQRTFTSQHRRVDRGVLQSAAVALCAGLPIRGRIRAKGRRSGRISGCTDGVFCEQRERRKDFERAAGDGDSNAVPFPRPLLLLGDARTLLRKRKLCPKKLCRLRGSPHLLGPTWVQLGPTTVSTLPFRARDVAATASYSGRSSCPKNGHTSLE